MSKIAFSHCQKQKRWRYISYALIHATHKNVPQNKSALNWAFTTRSMLRRKNCAQECMLHPLNARKNKKCVVGESESRRCIKDFIKTRLFLPWTKKHEHSFLLSGMDVLKRCVCFKHSIWVTLTNGVTLTVFQMWNGLYGQSQFRRLKVC